MVDLDNWLSGRYRISPPGKGAAAELDDSQAAVDGENDSD
jgi:endogenous inhibitor of DNA gyrase (YacG/DUF329 family)